MAPWRGCHRPTEPAIAPTWFACLCVQNPICPRQPITLGRTAEVRSRPNEIGPAETRSRCSRSWRGQGSEDARAIDIAGFRGVIPEIVGLTKADTIDARTVEGFADLRTVQITGQCRIIPSVVPIADTFHLCLPHYRWIGILYVYTRDQAG